MPADIRRVDDLDLPPGLVGKIARHGQLKSRRDTHIFALGGALAGLSAASAGNYILKTPDGLTPLGLLVMGVGTSGAGKETLTDVAEFVAGRWRGDHLGPNATFASSQAFHQALTVNRAQLWTQAEVGRHLKAVKAQTGGHDYQFISAVMDVHAKALGTFSGTARAKASENRPPVKNAFLAAALASAPDPVRDALDRESVEGGFMGRVLAFWTTGDLPTFKPFGGREAERAAADALADGLVSGQRFAEDTSLIDEDANKQNSTPKEDWDASAITPQDAPRAMRENLDALDDAALGAAFEVEPKFTSHSDSASQWTAAR